MQTTIIQDLKILEARDRRDFYEEQAANAAVRYCHAKLDLKAREEGYYWEQYLINKSLADGLIEALNIMLTEASYA